MNIVICIKPQVSGADVIYASDTGQPVRPVLARMGSTDEVALQAGLDFRKRYGGSVTVLSVAGAGAEADECLNHCLKRGADRALRVEYIPSADKLDTAASARQAGAIVLSEAADIIFCASQSDDLGSGFFPYALAASADYCLVTGVIDIEFDGENIKAVRKLERGWRERYELQLPLVIGVDAELAQPQHSAVLGRGYRQAMAVPIECREAVAESGVASSTELQELGLTLPQARRRPVSRGKSRGSSRDMLRRKRPGAAASKDGAGPVRLDGDPADIGRQLVSAIRGWLKTSAEKS